MEFGRFLLFVTEYGCTSDVQAAAWSGTDGEWNRPPHIGDSVDPGPPDVSVMIAGQYSSGNKKVVALRSLSVMTQSRSPFEVR
jgi:hypothetical protein